MTSAEKESALWLLAAGWTQKKVAEHLGRSQATVANLAKKQQALQEAYRKIVETDPLEAKRRMADLGILQEARRAATGTVDEHCSGCGFLAENGGSCNYALEIGSARPSPPGRLCRCRTEERDPEKRAALEKAFLRQEEARRGGKAEPETVLWLLAAGWTESRISIWLRCRQEEVREIAKEHAELLEARRALAALHPEELQRKLEALGAVRAAEPTAEPTAEEEHKVEEMTEKEKTVVEREHRAEEAIHAGSRSGMPQWAERAAEARAAEIGVSVLGTVYTVRVCSEAEDARLLGANGITDWSSKEILLEEAPAGNVRNMEEAVRSVLRHEIVHAFIQESGMPTAPWATEEMVDWLALQGEKIWRAWQEIGAVEA